MYITEVLVLEEVENDLDLGKQFYDLSQIGVGDYFYDTLLSDIESLIIYAGVHAKQFGLLRMLSRRFPYAIYYQINGSIAYVIAVLPLRKDPAWIQKMLLLRK